MPKTILHFFSPKSTKKDENKESPKSNAGTPHRPKNSPLTPISDTNNQRKVSKLFGATPPVKTIGYNICDVVWARLDGYPWWPSIVCDDPKDRVYLKTEGNKKLIHVQFFDVPVTHAWVEARSVAKYMGSDSIDFRIGGKFYSSDLDVIEATKMGDEALKKVVKERKKLLVNFEDSIDDFNDDLDDMLVDACDESTTSKQDTSVEENESEKTRRKAAKKISKKRRRIQSNSDDDCESEDEFVPAKEEESDEEEEESEDPETEPDETPVKNSRKRKRNGSIPTSTNTKTPLSTPSSTKLKGFTPSNSSISRTPVVSQQTKSRLSLFHAEDADISGSPESTGGSKYLHETLEFLFPQNICDKYGRKRDDPDYDPTTLKIPYEYFKKISPAMLQWWKLKVDYYDVVFCFKVGKFYELYHMDAVVGVNELGLIYMKGNYAHSGFPEVAFGRYSESLVQKGYKVARVEQTETPDQNAQRVKKEALPKQGKTLRREICRIITKGTQSLGSWPGSGSLSSGNNFLLAVTERSRNMNSPLDGAPSNLCRDFGVCFIDTSVGTFHVGQFSDDRHCSALCTMLSHYTPCQILYERGKVSVPLQKILRSGLSSILQEALIPNSQFWDATKTLKHLKKEEYFVKDGNEEWPKTLQSMMDDDEAVTLSASRNYGLAISALGGCVFYLKKCLIDFEVLSMKQFVEYKPLKSENPHGVSNELEDEITNFAKGDSKIVLDSVTLANLEILENTNGGTEGTLIEVLDKCRTPFGKRLLRQWLCAPPCNPEISSDRLDALEDLMGSQEFVAEAYDLLKNMPDLERMLMKIHSLSKGSRKSDHPDNRAVLYDEDKYSKKKIEDFLAILRNYDAAHKLLEKYQNSIKNFKSSLLRKILGISGNEGREFPNMKLTLDRWKTAFNHKKALETGKITPNHGANPEYDEALGDIDVIQSQLDAYLKQQKRELSCSSIIYKGSGNKRFQLEMPVDVADGRNLSGYMICGQRKGFKSFRTDETAEFLKDMETAETRRDAAQSETMAIIFREFDQDFTMWNKAVQCLSTLDVLLSLVEYCKNSESEMTRPIIVWEGPKSVPFLEIHNGRHPCVTSTFFGDDFIPNDTFLGCHGDGDVTKNPNCLVLTGPNMGGKSTLMRQNGLITILAHIGCYVPAEYCRLTPVDRVFTRLGASDRIMSGESTFYVELSETSAILKHATKHSLVLLDELGRGTATYDGTAIALAVVKEISTHVKCRTIFSTHYHTVVDDLQGSKDVFQGHMACMVENEDADNEDPSKETLTFLYKLTDGPCPKSYGFHAARLADVPESIITLARRKAAELENYNKCVSAFRAICTADNLQKLGDMVPNGI